jgi:hypothetical protein
MPATKRAVLVPLPPQENMVCACTRGRLPSVADCQSAAALTGFDNDVAQLPDGYQTLVRLADAIV